MFSNFGSRLTSLRRAMAGEEVDDPDDENCSYISNVLRQYYTERNRPYPNWLPPDPKGKIPTPTVAPQLVTSHSTPAFQGYGSNQNNGGGSNNINNPSNNNQPTPSPITRPGQGSGLGDLWGDSGSAATAPQVTSLRRGRTPQSGPATPSGTPQTAPPSSLQPNGGGYFDRGAAGGAGREGANAAYASPGSMRGPSAQERLRARLHGRGG